MEKLRIKRFIYTPDATFGTMEMPDGTKLFTVEQAWRDNEAFKSCIPEGEFNCRPRDYHRGGYPAIHIHDVPGRTHILFHKGNTHHDVRGCIAPGMKLGFINNVWGVENSGGAFNTLMSYYGESQFELKILSYEPENGDYVVHTRPKAPRRTRGRRFVPDEAILREHGVALSRDELTNPDQYQVLTR